MINETFDYVQYLNVKKSIDDRSLNKNVWNIFSTWLKEENKQGSSIKVLEIGAGIGTMIERLLEASLLKKCQYVALEPEPSFKAAALERLKTWSEHHNCNFSAGSNGCWFISSTELDINIEWITSSADSIEQLFEKENFDLVLSHAVIDLLPVPEIMPMILETLKKKGGYYFSLNFSGKTEFQPGHESDTEISNQYHANMDNRFPGLDWQPSLTGSLLPKWLEGYAGKKNHEGESNWELNAGDQIFINNILDTIKKALHGLPVLDDWLRLRYRQLEQGQLELKISNRDCFGLKQT